MSVCKAFEIDEVGIKELGKQRGNKGVKSVNDAVALLQKEGRRHLLNEAFGIDAKRVTPFSENDRGEERIVADTYAWIELFIGSEKK